MEVYNCIRSRRTVRNFKTDQVPRRIVNRILRAGRWAPSSSNGMPWHFVVVQDPVTIKSLGEIATQGSFISQAPLVIAIVMDNAARPDLDAGRALQQMELVAWSEGMGTCFVGLRAEGQKEKLKDMLGIPQEMDLITLLPFGYRENDFQGRGTPRKPMTEMAHAEKFGQAYVIPS